MNNLDFNELCNVFHIYEDLTPDKLWKTYVAFYKNSNLMNPIIIKEMDKKRACIYQALSHMWNPYIANVYSVHHLPNTQIDDGEQLEDVYIAITENVGDISLTDYVHSNGPLNHNIALNICVQICEGLSEFHKKGFVHRDIKPDNIIMFSTAPDNIRIKIIDFGAAKTIQKGQNADTTVVGTLGYQAPESLSSITQEPADIFAIGCVLNFMLTGQEPGIQRYIEKSSIASIIEKSTSVDPSSRYFSVDELKKVLLHEIKHHKLDKIPLIRSIPGFRTHTFWKMTLATLVYLGFFYLISIQLIQKLYVESLTIVTFWFLTPLIIVCNLGNLLRFLPRNIRENSKQMFIFRIVSVLIAFFLPLIIEYFSA